MTKPTDKPKKPRDPSTLLIRRPETEDEGKVLAETFSRPEVRAAQTIQRFEGELLDVTKLAEELRLQTSAIKSGDMSRAVIMLAAQAHTLDALFANLATRAHSNMNGGYLDAGTIYMKLALKAQAQCIRTIEALGELKNPKQIAYVGQANFAGGHQQVNNHPAQAGENKIEQTKLSAEDSNELLPDTRAQSNAGSVNQKMEALGAIHRPQNTSR